MVSTYCIQKYTALVKGRLNICLLNSCSKTFIKKQRRLVKHTFYSYIYLFHRYFNPYFKFSLGQTRNWRRVLLVKKVVFFFFSFLFTLMNLWHNIWQIKKIFFFNLKPYLSNFTSEWNYFDWKAYVVDKYWRFQCN